MSDNPHIAKTNQGEIMKIENEDRAGAQTAIVLLLLLGFVEALADLFVWVWPW